MLRVSVETAPMSGKEYWYHCIVTWHLGTLSGIIITFIEATTLVSRPANGVAALLCLLQLSIIVIFEESQNIAISKMVLRRAFTDSGSFKRCGGHYLGTWFVQMLYWLKTRKGTWQLLISEFDTQCVRLWVHLSPVLGPQWLEMCTWFQRTYTYISTKYLPYIIWCVCIQQIFVRL